jgi:hypothetical protein
VYEDDVEVQWPASYNELWIPPESPSKRFASEPIMRTMQFVIPVTRVIPQLKKTIKAATISRATLETYDEYFHSIILSYPEKLQVQSEQPLEPYLLQAVFPLQAARQLLYRHNLSPQCSNLERREAVERCLSAAFDTLHYVTRCLRWRPSPASSHEPVSDTAAQEQLWNTIRFHANNFICMHIWRTTLMFCLKRKFQAALTCVKLSKAIGDARQVNIACGRFLSFFLQRITEELDAIMLHKRSMSNNTTTSTTYDESRPSSAVTPLEENEEMIAYASGDLQADPDNAWIWAGGGTGAINAPKESTAIPVAREPPEIMEESENLPREVVSVPKTALLTDAEKKDWGGWERVEALLEVLIEGEQQRQREESENGHNERYHRPAHNPDKRIRLDANVQHVEGGEEKRRSQVPQSAGASRISIANII